jgi:hypothetical protein
MQVKRLGRLLLVPIFFLSGSLTGLAQTSGSLRGIVEDETGIAIATAEVIINGKTGQMSHTTGNEMGEFIFTGLTPGDYVLRAAHDGGGHCHDLGRGDRPGLPSGCRETRRG